MPLRLRLTVVFAVIAAVLVAAGSWFFVTQLERNLRNTVDHELEARAVTLNRALEDSPAGRVGDDAQRLLVTSPRAFGQVLDPDGGIVAASSAVAERRLLDNAQLADARRGRRFVDLELEDLEVDEVRLLAEPVQRSDGDWVIVVGSSIEPAEHALERVRGFLLIGGIAGVGLAVAGAWLLAGAALRPVERMRSQVAEISERDPTERIGVPATRDEIAALARTMNGLLDRLTAALARERRLVSDTAHELRSPLAVLRTELELAQRPGRSPDDLGDAIANAAEHTDRLARLTDDLLLLSRSDEGAPLIQPHHQPLAPLVRAAARAAAGRARARNIHIATQTTDGLHASVDEHRLRQALDNLVDNALRVAPPGSTITLTAHHNQHDDVVIAVRDQGPGFPAEFLPHALERFSRADPARARHHGGAGLGLAIVDTITQAHGGHIQITNSPDHGATVAIVLPSQPPHPPT